MSELFTRWPQPHPVVAGQNHTAVRGQAPAKAFVPVRHAPDEQAARRIFRRLPLLAFCAEAIVRCTEQDGALWHLFDARDVPRFFAREKYSCFFWHGASGVQEHLLADSLDVLSQRLSCHGFVRVHRAELVNLRFARHVRLSGRRRGLACIELLDGQCAVISRRRVAHVKASLLRLEQGRGPSARQGVRALP